MLPNRAKPSAALARALAWGRLGPVHPCYIDAKGNKKPHLTNWPERASMDPDVITAMWEEYPDAIPGLVLARAPVPLFVVDVDPHHGGDPTFAQLERLYGFKAGDLPSQRSLNGGRHYFFRGVAATTVGKLGPGVDTRGGNPNGTGLGFILCYEPEPPCAEAWECPVAPDAFGEAIGAPRHISQIAADTRTPVVEYDLPENIEKAVAYLRRVAPAIQGEGGDLQTFKVACAVKDFGISPVKCLELMEEHFDPRCKPSWGDRLVEKVSSAYRNGQLPPGIHGSIGKEGWTKILENEPGDGAQTSVLRQTIIAARDDDDNAAMAARFAATPWIIPGRLWPGCVRYEYGDSGIGKSSIVTDLAHAVATEARDTWAGYRVRDHGAVAWFAGEDIEGTVFRLEALGRAYGSTGIFKAWSAMPDFTNAERRNEWAAILRNRFGGAPRLIVVDTFVLALAASNRSENDATDVSALIAGLRAFAALLDNAAVIVIGHTGKDANKGPRGSSAIRANCDADAHYQKSGDVVILTDGKTRRVPPGAQPLAFRIRSGDTGYTDVDDRRITAQLVELASAAETRDAKDRLVSDAYEAAIDHVLNEQSGTISTNALAKQALASWDAAMAACDPPILVAAPKNDEVIRNRLRGVEPAIRSGKPHPLSKFAEIDRDANPVRVTGWRLPPTDSGRVLSDTGSPRPIGKVIRPDLAAWRRTYPALRGLPDDEARATVALFGSA